MCQRRLHRCRRGRCGAVHGHWHRRGRGCCHRRCRRWCSCQRRRRGAIHGHRRPHRLCRGCDCCNSCSRGYRRYRCWPCRCWRCRCCWRWRRKRWRLLRWCAWRWRCHCTRRTRRGRQNRLLRLRAHLRRCKLLERRSVAIRLRRVRRSTTRLSVRVTVTCSPREGQLCAGDDQRQRQNERQHHCQYYETHKLPCGMMGETWENMRLT
jgi:hypothetical protein